MAVLLRGDFDASRLRGLAKKTKDGPQARRLLALAAIYDGATRTEAAKIGGVGVQIIRQGSHRAASSLSDSASSYALGLLHDRRRLDSIRPPTQHPGLDHVGSAGALFGVRFAPHSSW